jgi:hypothetical protein
MAVAFIGIASTVSAQISDRDTAAGTRAAVLEIDRSNNCDFSSSPPH